MEVFCSTSMLRSRKSSSLLVTVSQLRQRVSLVSTPWKMSLIQVWAFSGLLLMVTPTPPIEFVAEALPVWLLSPALLLAALPGCCCLPPLALCWAWLRSAARESLSKLPCQESCHPQFTYDGLVDVVDEEVKELMRVLLHVVVELNWKQGTDKVTLVAS